MQAEILHLIDDELSLDNIKTEHDAQKIVWTDDLGAENFIDLRQTAMNNDGVIAWWQCNEAGKEQVRIRLKQRKVITWKLPVDTLEHPSFRDGLLFFHENHLIIKYKDKYYQRVFIFNINTLKTEEIIINALTIQTKMIDHELFLAGLYGDEEFIKITMHADYFEKEEIDESYLRERNITFDS